MSHLSKHPQKPHFAFLKKNAPLTRKENRVFEGEQEIRKFDSIRQARRYMRTGWGERRG